MLRPQAGASKSGAGTSPTKHNASNTLGDNVQSTIREIRSRTISLTSNNNARQSLASRRQTLSMERLNGSATNAPLHNNQTDKEKSSTTSGSSTSINGAGGSATSSPSRSSSTSSNGLNRTASRVSRFRSAKAVFERLSTSNSSNSLSNASSKPERPPPPEKPRGTVASRYAAAAAARAAAAQQQIAANATSSPRARATAASRAGADLGRSSSTSEINRFAASPRHEPATSHQQPRPQPRVITTTTRKTVQTSVASSQQAAKHDNSMKSSIPSMSNTSTSTKTPAPAKQPPPRDLIDKIVLEIARDAGATGPDADCTIQDLSDCNISGIPETLDFDRCFQDVEMMTEEEARRLLSRKSDQTSSEDVAGSSELNQAPTSSVRPSATDQVDNNTEKISAESQFAPQPSVSSQRVETSLVNLSTDEPANEQESSNSLIPPLPTAASSGKTKVRFSDEPIQVYDTHAVEDYDRRNDDIDPVAASAEYEIEKSKERAGIKDSDDDDDDDDDDGDETEVSAAESVVNRGAVNDSDRFTQENSTITARSRSSFETTPNSGAHHHVADDRTSHARSYSPARGAAAGQAHASANSTTAHDSSAAGQQLSSEPKYSRDYVESLEREVSLKRILEQNLRDLQSQYYDAVKKLDEHKGTTSTKLADLQQNVASLNDKLESAQNELSDARTNLEESERKLNELKESSQLLEKKYHRAKRIIKDMQLREESFTRREQLYQQKLDEIEHELGALIDSIDRTILGDGPRFCSVAPDSTSATGCQRQHQTKLDAFGLMRQMLNNFSQNQSTQNAQIKQRVVAIFEQQLANLMAAQHDNHGTYNNGHPSEMLNSLAAAAAGSNKQSITGGGGDNHSHGAHSNGDNGTTKHGQSYQLASHRLSQPNLPHPIGVGGQPTKLFHDLNTMPSMSLAHNEPSPPQSVNSYPSSNSLNSLNNNNNVHINNNNGSSNNNMVKSKLREQLPLGPHNEAAAPLMATSLNIKDESFQPVPTNIPPYQSSDEWHDKPVSEWTTNQVSTWLLALGLDQYISKFEDRNVNGQSLINLDSTVLKGLGVLNSSDRNLLKKKIRELRVEMEKERKLLEKKLKENMKQDKSKMREPAASQTNSGGKPSWKKGLLS